MDIVIYMNEDDFKHKTGQPSKQDPESGPITAYWEMKRPPRHFCLTDECDDRIYLACKGFVRGSVQCDEFYPDEEKGWKEETLVWDSRTYVLLKKPIPCKPFRGFRYRWFDYELEETKNAKRT